MMQRKNQNSDLSLYYTSLDVRETLLNSVYETGFFNIDNTVMCYNEDFDFVKKRNIKLQLDRSCQNDSLSDVTNEFVI